MNHFPILLAALFLANPGILQASADPLAREIAAMEQKGFVVSERMRDDILAAVVFHRTDGGQGDRLRVYRISRGRAQMIYLEINPVMRLSFSAIHRGGKMPDLAGDGSKIFAYSSTFPGTEQQALVVLRWAKGKLVRLRDYPFAEFEDVAGDGTLQLVAHARPLGALFAIECSSFRTMAQAAFQTRIYSWKNGALARDSDRFQGYFQEHIARLERELSSKDPRKTNDYGGYLGSALSLYFDRAEIGQGHEGWNRFVSLFPVHTLDPPQVKRCMKQMETTMRRALNIPEDW